MRGRKEGQHLIVAITWRLVHEPVDAAMQKCLSYHKTAYIVEYPGRRFIS